MTREKSKYSRWLLLVAAAGCISCGTGDTTPEVAVARHSLTIPLGKIIYIRAAANNKIVTAQGGDHYLYANPTQVTDWERFLVEDRGGGNVALKCVANGKYVSADLNHYAFLIADRAMVGGWETFTWIELANGNFALKALATNKYVSSDQNAYSLLIANRDVIGGWETFSHYSIPDYRFLNKIIDATASDTVDGAAYASGASIIYWPPALAGNATGLFFMYYCAPGVTRSLPDPNNPAVRINVPSWNSIKYRGSDDGRTWSDPVTVLSASNPYTERTACDPSAVRFTSSGEGTYFYLFYSGSGTGVQSRIFVARSQSPGGPFEKFTNGGGWERWQKDALYPQPVIDPINYAQDGSGYYGAGQPTVVVKNGRLHIWYTDDTYDYPNATLRNRHLIHNSSTFPWTWGVSNPTNLEGSTLFADSVDVKYDPGRDQFVLFDIDNELSSSSFIRRMSSTDGFSFINQETVDATPNTRYAGKIGVSGDETGALIGDTALITFDAPPTLGTPPVSANSDMYASVINPAGDTWNDIHWGWKWQGMTPQHTIAVGDYDGDGRTDRAITNFADQRWHVISSSTGAAGVPGIPWGNTFSQQTPQHILALGDYDGDGTTDRGIVNPNDQTWSVKATLAAVGGPPLPLNWHWDRQTADSRLALGDYDHDGRTDRVIVNPDGRWFAMSSATGLEGVPGIPAGGWQWAGMTPQHQIVAADYDGDGITDRAISHPTDLTWYVCGSSSGGCSGVPGIPWGDVMDFRGLGLPERRFMLGDYDGDGRTDRSVANDWIGGLLVWWVKPTATAVGAPPILPLWLDSPNDTELVVGDFDGDGKADHTYVIRSSSRWYIDGSRPFRIY